MRYGAGRLPVVIGATVTVRRKSCISGGEMITHGRVFWISLPIVGSSVANHTFAANHPDRVCYRPQLIVAGIGEFGPC